MGGCTASLIVLAGMILQLLIYAEDLFLLAPLWLELQHQLDVLAQFCDSMGLTVNMSKMKTIPDTASKFHYKWKWNEHTEKYKYLGYTLPWKTGVEERASALLQSDCHKANVYRWGVKHTDYMTKVTAMALYGAERQKLGNVTITKSQHMAQALGKATLSHDLSTLMTELFEQLEFRTWQFPQCWYDVWMKDSVFFGIYVNTINPKH
ncbi:hypothetical protein SELMODRAFT_415385 [Selaginella moellendorffii]|uniref:Reverse transcriptase domain-containing protein n=1 Tax=Selaginella moellendorffii TaxID=88036 RepID=D8RVY6_SELML|nr:hypothetical protein SELMODRAFT_415385 [Selaginella moellendorffii]